MEVEKKAVARYMIVALGGKPQAPHIVSQKQNEGSWVIPREARHHAAYLLVSHEME